MNIPKVGSRWWSGDGNKFMILGVVAQENHVWIHYRDDNGETEPKEYSCYVESFVQRFTELPT